MISGGSPYTINPTNNIAAGYTQNSCYRCVSGGVNHDNNFQIVQTALDCTLTPISIAAPLATIAYGASVTSYDHTNFFTPTIVPAACSLSCSLTDPPCGTALTGTGVSMPSATSPFTITPISSIVAGYSKSACYRCNSGGTDYDFSFQIVQTPDCTLTGISIATPLATIAHGASVTSYDHTNFFTPSSVPAGCSLACSLTDQACGTALTGSEI